MLKITGAFLCILGCAGYGVLKIEGWNKALEELEQWILLFEKMRGHILYRKDVIAEACCQMEQKIFGIGGKYVAKIGYTSKEERARSFADVWNEIMSEWNVQSNLPTAIKKMIMNFPDYIGEQNCEQQISYLDFFIDNLKKEKNVMDIQVQGKRKPVMALSLVGGVIISILLF